MSDEIDFDFFFKLDNISLKDAAIVLCGLNPFDYKSVRFNKSSIIAGLEAPQKVYLILRSVDFWQKYQLAKPKLLDYLVECRRKDISIPDPVIEAGKRRFQYDQNYRAAHQAPGAESKTDAADVLSESNGARERNYLVKMIGALASVYYKQKIKATNPQNPSVTITEIVQDIQQYIEDHSLYAPGLGKSNLYKKIAEGIEAFDNEFALRLIKRFQR